MIHLRILHARSCSSAMVFLHWPLLPHLRRSLSRNELVSPIWRCFLRLRSHSYFTEPLYLPFCYLQWRFRPFQPLTVVCSTILSNIQAAGGGAAAQANAFCVLWLAIRPQTSTLTMTSTLTRVTSVALLTTTTATQTQATSWYVLDSALPSIFKTDHIAFPGTDFDSCTCQLFFLQDYDSNHNHSLSNDDS